MTDEIRAFVPVRKDLLMRELKDEVILYDTTMKRAHCLNDTAAAVWRLCDGRRNVREIAHVLEKDEELVWMALQDLEDSGVLNRDVPQTIRSYGLSRRELVMKIGVGAAVALPMVSSILVPTASAAPSPPTKQSPRRVRR
jgi:hypothetical protein